MERDIENIVRQSLASARAAGRDHWTQIKEAAHRLGEIHGDITEAEALALVISNMR